MNIKKRVSSALLAWIILAPTFVRGQSYQPFETRLAWIKERAKLRFGPFRLYPAILFRDIGYDNNVYFQRENERPIGDYTATISPSLSAYLLYRNWIIFSIVENPEYVFFFKQKKERSLNNNFSPELKIQLFHQLVLSGNYRYQKSRRRASSEFDIRADEQIQGYRGQFFYETARQTSIGVSLQQLKLRYEDISQPNEQQSLSLALNRIEKSGDFEFYYRVFSESFLFIKAGYTDYRFEFEESQKRNATSYQFAGGIQFPLVGRFRGILSLGYKRFRPTDRGRKAFSGLVGNTNLDCRLDRFSLRLSYERDCQFSYYLEYVYFLENILGGGISCYLTKFLRLDYDLTYGENNYPEPSHFILPDGSSMDLLRKDHYLNHAVGAVFRVIRNTGIGIVFNYWKRDSNITFEKRSRWFLGGYVTFDF